MRYFIIILIANNFLVNAQIKKENLKFGFTYGVGSQDRHPYKLKDHTHTITFYKAQINYKLKQNWNWAFELNLEPSYNLAMHQLKNKLVLSSSDGANYLELREHFSQRQTIKEYVLNLGLIIRYTIYKGISSYAIGSVGPMISNKGTERLAKGFAFSDVFGFGVSFQIGKTQFDFRYSMRHTSNLNIKIPNKGHNTMNVEYSLLFNL